MRNENKPSETSKEKRKWTENYENVGAILVFLGCLEREERSGFSVAELDNFD
jgi:molybdopterin synthase catalytic subunit